MTHYRFSLNALYSAERDVLTSMDHYEPYPVAYFTIIYQEHKCITTGFVSMADLLDFRRLRSVVRMLRTTLLLLIGSLGISDSKGTINDTLCRSTTLKQYIAR